MEPLTIFAATVAFIGIFHLLSTAVNRLGKGRNVGAARTTETRSDWYCFFKTSDLLGQDKVPVAKREELDNDIRQEDLLEQKRQHEARRPRLYA